MTTISNPSIDPVPAIGVQQLLAMPHAELLALWKTLPAPDLSELDGEYAGYIPVLHLSPEQIQGTKSELYKETSARGSWVGKAFKAGDGATSEGHNVFRRLADDGAGQIYLRKGRYATDIGESYVDGRPSLMMRYGAFNTPLGQVDLVDEVRRYATGLYVATATSRTETGGARTVPDGCFLLAGPFNPWIGVDDPQAELL
ncbi:hypothetical protein AB0L65_40460 [Nonomuraea sp. NPDC052116]|uniref:hypothetical protein n=1 Tax=Nonomuraea sp. NPDC052116 TaxID=3155665 RepID=UPI003423EA2D